MLRNFFVGLILVQVFCDEYEDNVQFVLFNQGKSSMSTFNNSLNQLGCTETCNFSFITHGWMGSSSRWIPDLVKNLATYRQGCIIFMNYSHYSDNPNYFELKSHFQPLANLVTRKLRQIRDDGISSDCMFIFGFSFGGRLAIQAALQYGPGEISMIDTCDMAGPGFDFFHWEDPKKAAKNVQCIHTSFYAGTIERNCHQNWIMGDCGKSQPAADDLMAMFCGITRSCPNETLFSHNVCPYLYNSAFSHDFVANNYHNCSSHRMAKNLPVNFKMGYMETRKNSSIIGDIPAPTSKYYPYTGV